VLIVFVVATAVVAVALLTTRPWAAVAAYALEGLAVVLALTRIGTRPRAAVVALVLSAAIIALVRLGSTPAERSTA
jgi:uncharacterized membrane protein